MKPITESVNPRTKDIDRLSSLEIVTLINNEDRAVAESVARVLPEIAKAVDLIVERMNTGGRLLYIGCGTSGRLGVLDASECPPTFGVSADLVQGIIAGGYEALRQAVEGAEDNYTQAEHDLRSFGVSSQDCIVGISAGGNTPYTLGAIDYGRKLGAVSIALTCNPDSRMAAAADVSIAVTVGPEAIAGSSRLKGGTAQKMVLNMLSTATMIRRGLVFSNLMTNLKASNEKLRRRACSILASETHLSSYEAIKTFEDAGRDLRVALLMVRSQLSRDEAEERLQSHGGSLRRTLDALNSDEPDLKG